jgi:hypothetical protein
LGFGNGTGMVSGRLSPFYFVAAIARQHRVNGVMLGPTRDVHPEMLLLFELSSVDCVDESGRDLLSRNNLMGASLVDEIVHSRAQFKE